MSDAIKWTPERCASFKRVIESARSFVRCADEFADDYPEACGESMQALIEAIDADGRVWDEDPRGSLMAVGAQSDENVTEPSDSGRV